MPSRDALRLSGLETSARQRLQQHFRIRGCQYPESRLRTITLGNLHSSWVWQGTWLSVICSLLCAVWPSALVLLLLLPQRHRHFGGQAVVAPYGSDARSLIQNQQCPMTRPPTQMGIQKIFFSISVLLLHPLIQSMRDCIESGLDVQEEGKMQVCFLRTFPNHLYESLQGRTGDHLPAVVNWLKCTPEQQSRKTFRTDLKSSSAVRSPKFRSITSKVPWVSSLP